MAARRMKDGGDISASGDDSTRDSVYSINWSITEERLKMYTEKLLQTPTREEGKPWWHSNSILRQQTAFFFTLILFAEIHTGHDISLVRASFFRNQKDNSSRRLGTAGEVSDRLTCIDNNHNSKISRVRHLIKRRRSNRSKRRTYICQMDFFLIRIWTMSGEIGRCLTAFLLSLLAFFCTPVFLEPFVRLT